ncbi:hypothetical protein AMATHDRAFT_46710 [Amanita thiersii Skay4041]|uniref:Uncharacterized protein n=1 Tax=Amanita thiersii Skay4041 TaxID=703135 RepID=A0A2A9NUI0_9AGAR|nr:hypothetical protein AMATHDRAFT_46710 [Amanita thiersii Skay4041]
MSLDQNLFTLHFTQSKDNPNVVDLVDPSGIVHYRKQRIPGQEYKIEVYDPMSEALLATATGSSNNSKHKTLELHNPSTMLDLKFTGTLSFKWTFKWEDHEFEWKREECYILRKPDPPVLVAVTKEPSGRLKTTSAQILDYNINRFDINDRKGLEIVILTALLTFQDYNESYHPRNEGSTPGFLGVRRTSSGNQPASTSTAPSPISAMPLSPEISPPQPPPKPAPKMGIDKIAEMQALRGEVNEVVVEEDGMVNDYAQYCFNLLKDDAMLFISVKSAGPEQVPKVLQVVEEAKRLRYKTGISDDEELHQYVVYDTNQARKGPRRINLDDDGKKNKYTPPNSLTVHLSKISMPELQPKANAGDKKDPKKKEGKDEGKEANKPGNHSTSSSAPTLQAPTASQSLPHKASGFFPWRKQSPSNTQTNQSHVALPTTLSVPASSPGQNPTSPTKLHKPQNNQGSGYNAGPSFPMPSASNWKPPVPSGGHTAPYLNEPSNHHGLYSPHYTPMNSNHGALNQTGWQPQPLPPGPSSSSPQPHKTSIFDILRR